MDLIQSVEGTERKKKNEVSRRRKIQPVDCNMETALVSILLGLLCTDSRLQHRLLPEFPACLPTLQILNLLAPTTAWANSLKNVSLPPPAPSYVCVYILLTLILNTYTIF